MLNTIEVQHCNYVQPPRPCAFCSSTSSRNSSPIDAHPLVSVVIYEESKRTMRPIYPEARDKSHMPQPNVRDLFKRGSTHLVLRTSYPICRSRLILKQSYCFTFSFLGLSHTITRHRLSTSAASVPHFVHVQ